MPREAEKRARRAESQKGLVLLVVMLLVIMFTGLGLVGMRYTRLEFRSAGAYMDSTQAAALIEAAIAMVATDMRRNWDLPPGDNYMTQFEEAEELGDTDEIRIHFSTSQVAPTFDPAGDFVGEGDAGPQVPDWRLSGKDGTPLAETSVLSIASAEVNLIHSMYEPAPPPPGFSSSNEENQSFGWFYFEVTGWATYGEPQAVDNPLFARGRARARSRMLIGPITNPAM